MEKNKDVYCDFIVSTINKKGFNHFKHMNLNKFNTIVCNQFTNEEGVNFDESVGLISMLNMYDKGVSRSRNILLLSSRADYCVFADDDMVFYDSAPDVVIDYFKNNPDFDVLIFNLNDGDNRHRTSKLKKVRLHNFMKYGTARIAIRKSSIDKSNIWFNPMFGAGSKYGSGEDSIFLKDCIKKGLKVIAVPSEIATLENLRESTWFEGYNDKFFFDKGALFYAMSNRIYLLLILQFVFRKKKLYTGSISYLDLFKIMLKGASDFK